MAGAGNPSDRRIAVGRSQLVRRDLPVLPVGLEGCGPPILARGTAAFRRGDLSPRRGQRPAVPGMDQGVPLPRPAPGGQALQLAGAWRLAGTCGQGLHRGAAAGEAAGSPCTAGESASTGRTGSRNPDRATPTAPRTYPSAEPQARGGLTRGSPGLTIRRLGTTLRPPPISQLISRMAPARERKQIFSFKNYDDYSAIHTLISRPPGPPAFPVRPRPTGLTRPTGPAPAP